MLLKVHDGLKCIGGFIRKGVKRAKARVFRSWVAEALCPYLFVIGSARGAEAMHKKAFADTNVRGDVVLPSFDVVKAHNEFER